MSSEFLEAQSNCINEKCRVQFKFNNISVAHELVQENKFGWLIGAWSVITELPVVHMTKIHVQHQLMMPQTLTAAGSNFSSISCFSYSVEAGNHMFCILAVHDKFL